MSKPLFWIVFCAVQAIGLLLLDHGYFHSSPVQLIFGMILLLPGFLLAIAMFAAFHIMKSGSLVLLAPGILLAIGANGASWFAFWYALESKPKKVRKKMARPGTSGD